MIECRKMLDCCLFLTDDLVRITKSLIKPKTKPIPFSRPSDGQAGTARMALGQGGYVLSLIVKREVNQKT